MVLRFYVPPFQNLPHPSPDASMNAIFYESPGIMSVSLVVPLDAFSSSCQISSTNFLTDGYFSRFTEDSSLTIIVFNMVNDPFDTGMSIVVWQKFSVERTKKSKKFLFPAAPFF